MISFLLRSWFWLHLISLAAIVLQPSSPAIILGRYSRNSAHILILFFVLTPAVYGGTKWLAKRIDTIHFSQAQLIVAASIGFLLVFLCWLPTIGVTSSYIIVRLYLSFILFTCLIWIFSELRLPGWKGQGSTIAVVGLLLLTVAATRFPGLLWTDEGYMVTVAVGFSRTGHPTPLFWQPAPVQSFSLVYIGLSAWFRLLGVDLVTGRLFIFSLALATLGIVYLTLRSLYSNLVACAVVILGAGAFLYHNYLRTDVEVALFLAIAFYCFTLAERKKKNWPHLLVGLALGFSLDGHPIAYRFSFGFGLAYLVEYGLQLARKQRLLIYWPLVWLMVGGLTGFANYYLFYSATSAYFSSLTQKAQFAFNFATGWDVLVEQLNIALRTTPLLTGAALVGLVAAVQRFSALDRLLISVLSISLLSVAILYGYARIYYQIHNLVPLLLLAGGVFWSLERNSRPAVVAGINFVLIGATCALVIGGIRSSQGQNYTRILAFANRIREVVPHDMAFVGVDPMYIRMYDYPHFIEMTGPSWAALYSGQSEPDVWEQLHPEAVAVVRDYPIPPLATMLDYISENDLIRVRCWTDDEIGQVDLYMKSGVALQSEPCQPVDGE